MLISHIKHSITKISTKSKFSLKIWSLLAVDFCKIQKKLHTLFLNEELGYSYNQIKGNQNPEYVAQWPTSGAHDLLGSVGLGIPPLQLLPSETYTALVLCLVTIPQSWHLQYAGITISLCTFTNGPFWTFIMPSLNDFHPFSPRTFMPPKTSNVGDC